MFIYLSIWIFFRKLHHHTSGCSDDLHGQENVFQSERLNLLLVFSSLRVNGEPYVVGKSAERQGIVTQRTGAARYTKDYYGILAAAASGRLYERGREADVFGSHAPGDLKFRQSLMKAIIRDWEVEINRQISNFRVNYANTFDEPVGGLMNVLLTEDGQHYQHSDLNGGRSLVIDIGGFTTDWLAVNPGGEVDYSLARSIPMGIQNVLTDFEESFRMILSISFGVIILKETLIFSERQTRK